MRTYSSLVRRSRGAHRRGYQWTRGSTGSISKRFQFWTISVSRAASTRSWSLVLLENIEIPSLFFLQEFCIYTMSFLVWILLGILSSGELQRGLTIRIIFALLILDALRSVLRGYLQCLLLVITGTCPGRLRSGTIASHVNENLKQGLDSLHLGCQR